MNPNGKPHPKARTQRGAARVDRPTPAIASSTSEVDPFHKPVQRDSAGGTAAAQNGTGVKLPKTLAPKKKIVKTYPYVDEMGVFLYEVVRYEPKDFRQRTKDQSGKWVFSLDGIRRVLYRLPEVVNSEADTILVVEGEKDVDTAVSMGFLATCAACGANGWKPAFAEFLRRFRVVIIPDNDENGELYAESVATSLEGIARDWRIVRLPGLGNKGDLTDFAKAGGTADEVKHLIDNAFVLARNTGEYPVGNGRQHTLAQSAQSLKPKSPQWTAHLSSFDKVQDELLVWLWKGVWLEGAINILQGKPGVGKTYVLMHLIACITRGSLWPDGSGNAPLGDVLYCTAEQSLGAEVKPRLRAAGADLTRVFTWTHKHRTTEKGEYKQEGMTLEDLPEIEASIKNIPNLRCLTLDPLQSYLGSVDPNKNEEVRPLLEAIKRIAEERKFTVILVTHEKKSAAEAIDAGIGAQSFSAVARCTWKVMKDPDDETGALRCFSPVKVNNGPDDAGLRFRIVQESPDSDFCKTIWEPGKDYRDVNQLTALNYQKNAAVGGEVSSEKARSKRITDFFLRLDKLTTEAGSWVKVADLKKWLSCSSSTLSDTVLRLHEQGEIEVRWVDDETPTGGVRKGARQEVRRPQREQS